MSTTEEGFFAGGKTCFTCGASVRWKMTANKGVVLLDFEGREHYPIHRADEPDQSERAHALEEAEDRALNGAGEETG